MTICGSASTAFVAVALLASASTLVAASPDHPPSELIGVWRGTSVCSDRVAAPACNDEVVVYEFSPGSKPGIVRWKADKVVGGERRPMGELDIAWDRDDACWKTEFETPRVHVIWRVTVEGADLKGTATLLPGKQIVRRIQAHKD